MKNHFYLIVLLASIAGPSFGQFNPVQNLTFFQAYENMNNTYQLNWEAPAEPHAELIGYNIYRNDEFYRFQTETTLYYVYSQIFATYMTNDTGNFLLYFNAGQSNPQEFDIHVTAVYSPGALESDYLQTEHCYGSLLTATAFTPEKVVLYPNPAHGVVHIGNQGVQKFVLYDVSGKTVGNFEASADLDLSGYAKGLYLLKLYTEKGILVDKILVE